MQLQWVASPDRRWGAIVGDGNVDVVSFCGALTGLEGAEPNGRSARHLHVVPQRLVSRLWTASTQSSLHSCPSLT